MGRHGTEACYSHGHCKCPECLEAQERYLATYGRRDTTASPSRVALPQRPEWHDRAACNVPWIDTEIFYPASGEDFSEAKAICLDCPVIAECREWGIRHEVHGVWGGISAKARARERRRRGIHVNETDTQQRETV